MTEATERVRCENRIETPHMFSPPRCSRDAGDRPDPTGRGRKLCNICAAAIARGMKRQRERSAEWAQKDAARERERMKAAATQAVIAAAKWVTEDYNSYDDHRILELRAALATLAEFEEASS